MPIIYTDKVLEEKDYHPALALRVENRMIRYGKEGKSVFAWNRLEALEYYKWYVDNYSTCDIKDEFGVSISRYDWTTLIKDSYYTCYPGEQPSELTIREFWLDVQKQSEADTNPDINDILEEDDDNES